MVKYVGDKYPVVPKLRTQSAVCVPNDEVTTDFLEVVASVELIYGAEFATKAIKVRTPSAFVEIAKGEWKI